MGDRPRLMVINKMDLLTGGANGASALPAWKETSPGVLVSAEKRWNLDDLLREIEGRLMTADGPMMIVGPGNGGPPR